MKFIYHYLLDMMADWETGLAIAELNSQRFFRRQGEFQVQTVALRRKPVKTIGGLTILPDCEMNEVKKADAAMLILPGAEEWLNPEHEQALQLAADFLQSRIPVAAICGATEAMARHGMLDNVEHTSNGLEYLKMTCPEYRGEAFYKDELAVTAGDLITAGSSSSAAFAYHILRKLEVMEPKALEYWYGYFEKHSVEDVMKLFHVLESSQSKE